MASRELNAETVRRFEYLRRLGWTKQRIFNLLNIADFTLKEDVAHWTFKARQLKERVNEWERLLVVNISTVESGPLVSRFWDESKKDFVGEGDAYITTKEVQKYLKSELTLEQTAELLGFDAPSLLRFVRTIYDQQTAAEDELERRKTIYYHPGDMP